MPREKWPKWLRESPELMDGLEFTYRAFMDLTTCRDVGMGPGPIPWTAIRLYADTFEMPVDEFVELVFCLGQMDAAFLDYHRNKDAAKKTPMGGKKGRR